MGIIVNSPYSGQPVKVREQDVGRAVRDEENRIFYVLPRSDGSGYYGAMTRAGGEKDEQRAREMEVKSAAVRDQVHANVHDATGKRRSNIRGKLVILVLVVIMAVLAWLFTLGPLGLDNFPRVKTPTVEKDGPPPVPSPGEPQQTPEPRLEGEGVGG